MSEQYDEKLGKHGGDLETIAAQYDIQLDSLIDFSVNVNPLGAPEILAEIIQEGIALIGRYPDSASSRLCGKLASCLCVSPHQIIVGNGTTELIYLISRCFRPSRALLLQPTFTEYQRSVSIVDGRVLHHVLSPETNFRLNLKKLITDASAVDIVFSATPTIRPGIYLKKCRFSRWRRLRSKR